MPRFLWLFLAAFIAVDAAAEDLTLEVGGRLSIEFVSSDLFLDLGYNETLLWDGCQSGACRTTTMQIARSPEGRPLTGCEVRNVAGPASDRTRLLSDTSQPGCRVQIDPDSATPEIEPFEAGTTLRLSMCTETSTDGVCDPVETLSTEPSINPPPHDGKDVVRTTRLAEGVYQLGWERGPIDPDRIPFLFDDLVVVVRVEQDSDGDGLWDDWETHGIDTDGDGSIDLDLPAAGADPMRKDLFVEIDYLDCNTLGSDCVAPDTHTHRPKTAMVDALVAAFADAPVPNPDGSTGITLHLDVGNAIPHRNVVSFPSAEGAATSFDQLKADPANFGPENPRAFAYRYGLMAHRNSDERGGPAGLGEFGGNDFVTYTGEWGTQCIFAGTNGTLQSSAAVDDRTFDQTIFAGSNLICDTVASGDDHQYVAPGAEPVSDVDGDGLDDRHWATAQDQAGIVMHEFGHTLMLRHGGGDEVNFKPNYLSVMNYFHSSGMPLADPDGDGPAPRGDPDGAGPLWKVLDYSRVELPPLDEAMLNEIVGVGGDGQLDTRSVCPDGRWVDQPSGGPADWNCDGDGGSDASVSVDLNIDFMLGTLNGFDDWGNVVYAFQSQDSFRNGFHPNVPPEPNGPNTPIETNLAPVAVACEGMAAECKGDQTQVDLDGSCSSDPDGAVFLSYAWSAPDCAVGDPSAAITEALCPLGAFEASLVVVDELGAASETAVGFLEVVDTTPPVVSCNARASIIPPDAPISFQATAVDVCEGPTDVAIEAFECFRLTKRGRRVDKAESCDVVVDGAEITIYDSGGVDTQIAWTVKAVDGSGNDATAVCLVEVANPRMNEQDD